MNSTIPLFPVAAEEYRTCKYCKQSLHVSLFAKHAANRDGLDRRCKGCVKAQSRERREIMRTAPPRPDVCECCGERPSKWTMDHDHETKRFRGWVCESCNHGIGKLGDNITGLTKAIEYLKRSEKSFATERIQGHRTVYSPDQGSS